MQFIGTLIFIIALFNSFLLRKIHFWAHQFPSPSLPHKILLLFSEIEIVFGIWGAIYFIFYLGFNGFQAAQDYLTHLSFREPIFVASILILCSSQVVIRISQIIIFKLAALIPIAKKFSVFFVLLTLGPLLGSLISEPAAMTVTSLIALELFKKHPMPISVKYSFLGILFVNVSIGGLITPYAAPPIVMVAAPWGWDLDYTWTHFGVKTILCLILTSLFFLITNLAQLKKITFIPTPKENPKHSFSQLLSSEKYFLIEVLYTMICLTSLLIYSHNLILILLILFCFFILHFVTSKKQGSLKIKDGIYVAIFLAGLILMGPGQKWWLAPLIKSVSAYTLYFSAIILTSITDNAALTFLGSQVENLSELSKYLLVAGSVVGGGLTVIANAPNPIGYHILSPLFDKDGISPLQLFKNALIPTFIALMCFLI